MEFRAKKQFSDSTLSELVGVEEASMIVDWDYAWQNLYRRYQALENKIEALTEDVGERPVDISKVVRELTELSGDSVSFEIWDHAPVDDVSGHNVQAKLYAVKGARHFYGSTFEECEQAFRAVFAQVGSFAEADAKEKSQ